MGKGKGQGNQRADAKNPNNQASQAAANNRSNQMNPNNPAYKSAQSGNKK
jgi:hypothetical protein